MNPFKRIIFWITQFMAAALITVVGFIIIFRAYGRGKSSEDNLVNSIELETIKEIIIIQYKDTVHVEMDEHFFELLEQVKVSGPLKFNNKGKIIITRMDGSKDSLNTNGYGYGPYKGKWYQSKENVLDEYFKK